MTPLPEFIYFDLDDTLLDHQAAQQAALTDVLEHFSLFDGTDRATFIEMYGQVNKKQWMRYSQGDITKEQLQFNRFDQTMHALELPAADSRTIGNYYLSCYRNHWKWLDGAQGTFEAIRGRYPVGILTNGFIETQQKKFDQFGFCQSADHLVISEEAGALKPDPAIFEHATKLTGMAAKDIFYVGDSYHSDVVGGSNFGWQVGWLTSNGVSEQRNKATFVFNEFKELCNLLEV